MSSKVNFAPYPVVIFALLTMFASVLGIYNLVIIIILILLSPLILLFSFLWPQNWRINHWTLRNRIAVPFAIILIISILFTSWPLRVHFLLIRPELNKIATKVESGAKVNKPFRVGLFEFEIAEVGKNGIICVWLDESAGIGFIKSTSNDSPYNFTSTTKLDKDWEYVIAD